MNRFLTLSLAMCHTSAFVQNTASHRITRLSLATRQALKMPEMPSPPEVERPSSRILVSSLPAVGQQAAFAAVGALLCAGSVSVVNGLNGLEDFAGGMMGLWESTWPIGLGALYVAAGVSHFTNKADYEPIVPPKGTWGFFEVWFIF